MSAVASVESTSISSVRTYSVRIVAAAPTSSRRSTKRASTSSAGWWSMTMSTGVPGGTWLFSPGIEWSTNASSESGGRSSTALGSNDLMSAHPDIS